MKMSLLVRADLPHGRSGCPSNNMWTPWNTKRLGSPLIASTPFMRKMSWPCVWRRFPSHLLSFFWSRSPGMVMPTDDTASSCS